MKFIKHKTQLYISVLVTVLISASVLYFYQQGWFKPLDYPLYDLFFQWRPYSSTTSSHVTLVLLDQESALKLERTKGSWCRKDVAKSIYNLYNKNAEIIGIDLVFFNPSWDANEDIILRNAIAECGNVILARVSSGPQSISPIPLFQEAMLGDAFIDLPLDPDGILRRIHFFNATTSYDGNLFLIPSFSLELVRTYLNLSFDFDFSHSDHFLMGAENEKRIRLPCPDLLINFKGNYRSFDCIPFYKVVQNDFDPGLVQGRIVIIGTALSVDKDFFATPFSRFCKQNPIEYQKTFGKVIDQIQGEQDLGVSCHAHAVETILSQQFITIASANLQKLFIICCCMISIMFYLPALSTGLHMFLAPVFMLLSIALSYVLFFKSGVWLQPGAGLVIFTSQFITGSAIQKAFERKKTARVTRLFGQYVSEQVVKELIKDDVSSSSAGRHKELTIMFSDLRNFTALSETLAPKEIGKLLNLYFESMIPLIFQNQGTLDKLIGDCIMAFFGAPLDLENHAENAAKAALLMKEKLVLLKKTNKNIKGMDKINAGIGMNTGVVTVGNLGASSFMDYTIIGDPVNIASRIEGLTKVYGVDILISEETAKRLKKEFLIRKIDKTKVKGRDQAIIVFELMGYRKGNKKKAELKSLYEQGLEHYLSGNHFDARQYFKQCLALEPDDKPSARLISIINSQSLTV